MAHGSYIYGRHPVSEALRARPRDVLRLYLAAGVSTRLSDIERLAAHHRIPVAVLSRSALDDLVGGAPHQGVVAAVTPFAYAEAEEMLAAARQRGEAPLVLALDLIQDPHNLGALARSAYALGAHGLLFPKDRAADVTPAVVKAAAGATARLPMARVTNLRRSLEELKEAGLWVVGATAEGDRLLDEIDLTRPTAVVIGSEGKGLRRLIAETCDLLVRIPMTGTLGSLNASVAGAVVLYEASRQRRQAAERGLDAPPDSM